jgi:hypothetical protein
MHEHPVHVLRTILEAARLKAIESLAASSDPLPLTGLRELATIHTALSAVREEIQAHGIGWGGKDTGRPTGATTTLGNLQRATPRVWVYCEECPTARRWALRGARELDER